jgi:hypothetical protein
MMRFRAILSDPGNSNAERPLQILTNSRQDVEEWALGNNQSPGVLAKAVSPDAFVDVYGVEVRKIAGHWAAFYDAKGRIYRKP